MEMTMFGFIRDYITRKRLKRIMASAFPTEDENRQQKWISDWFTVKPTEGYTPRYFTIEAKIYDNRFLKHGEIMAKFVSNGLLEDHWKEFRQLTMDYWKELDDGPDKQTFSYIEEHVDAIKPLLKNLKTDKFKKDAEGLIRGLVHAKEA